LIYKAIYIIINNSSKYSYSKENGQGDKIEA